MPLTLVDRISRIFFGHEITGPRHAMEPGATAIGEGSRDPAGPGFDDHVLDAKPTSVVAGSLQLLGLDEIKHRLGSSWTSVSASVQAIVKQALDFHLQPGDVYRQLDDATFQLCFERADEAAARRKADAIALTIQNHVDLKLAGFDAALHADMFVGRVDAEHFTDAEDPFAALQASLADLRLAQAARRARQQSAGILMQAETLFQPVWSRHEYKGTKNRCILGGGTSGEAARYLSDIDSLDDLVEAIAMLDCVLFARSIASLHQSLDNQKPATLMVPVHLQTLAHRHEQFMTLAAGLPPSYRKFVVLDLIGIPSTATAATLLQALKVGRSVTDRVVVQLPMWDTRLTPAARGVTWGLSADLAALGNDQVDLGRELQRFAAMASRSGLYTFAYSANTIGKAAAAIGSGFDYVCGTAVHGTVAQPKPQSKFTPLFGGQIIRSAGNDAHSTIRQHVRFAPANPHSVLTLPDGSRSPCRILNVSASGAGIVSDAAVPVGTFVALGSVIGRVVRLVDAGFAIQFMALQQTSTLDQALQAPFADLPALGGFDPQS